MNNILLEYLQNKFEGICSAHGYIKKNSIQIIKYSIGTLIDFTLNGDVEYSIYYSAEVCNPAIGSVISAKVVNQNTYGIMADCSADGISILDVIIAKGSTQNDPSININDINVDDIINVEVMGKRTALNDTKMIIFGKLSKQTVVEQKVDIIEDVDTEEEDEEETDVSEDEDEDEDSSDEETESSESSEEEEEDDDPIDEEDSVFDSDDDSIGSNDME
jgi:DNA-directed RNA polymerase subunit E'/Rpb7